MGLLSFLDVNIVKKAGLDFRFTYGGYRVPTFMVNDEKTTCERFLELAVISERLADIITGRSKSKDE